MLLYSYVVDRLCLIWCDARALLQIVLRELPFNIGGGSGKLEGGGLFWTGGGDFFFF